MWPIRLTPRGEFLRLLLAVAVLAGVPLVSAWMHRMAGFQLPQWATITAAVALAAWLGTWLRRHRHVLTPRSDRYSQPSLLLVSIAVIMHAAITAWAVCDPWQATTTSDPFTGAEAPLAAIALNIGIALALQASRPRHTPEPPTTAEDDAAAAAGDVGVTDLPPPDDPAPDGATDSGGDGDATRSGRRRRHARR